MKRITAILTILLGIILCTSCGKDPVNEWSRFYGFTKNDLIGHYDANPDESLYQELPTEGVVVYDNASIDITEGSGNLITLRIVIPNVINKVFTGYVGTNESDSNVVLQNDNDDIMFTVYKNDKNGVRFHGRERYRTFDANGNVSHVRIYGFDVIKAEN